MLKQIGANRKLYELLAELVVTQSTQNDEWAPKSRDKANDLAEHFLPHGCGFDAGTHVDWKRSKVNRIVLYTHFHHINDGGFYDGWTEHSVVVTPSLVYGFETRITGRDRNEIKNYIGEEMELRLRNTIRTEVDDDTKFFRYTCVETGIWFEEYI